MIASGNSFRVGVPIDQTSIFTLPLDVSGFSNESRALLRQMHGRLASFSTDREKSLVWASFVLDEGSSDIRVTVLKDGVVLEGPVEVKNGYHVFKIGLTPYILSGALEDSGALTQFIQSRVGDDSVKARALGRDRFKIKAFWSERKREKVLIDVVAIELAGQMLAASDLAPDKSHSGAETPILIGGTLYLGRDGFLILGPNRQKLYVTSARPDFQDDVGKVVILSGSISSRSPVLMAREDRTMTLDEALGACSGLVGLPPELAWINRTRK